MEISSETINVLKKFSNIQQGLVIRAGNELGTISTGENVVAYATVEESFPMECGIYDLGEFLNVLNLFTDPILTFKEKSVVIKEKGSLRKLVYIYGDTSIIISPKKRLTMPDNPEVNFELSAENLADLKKAASVLSLNTTNIIVSGNAKGAEILVTDFEVPSCNTFSIPLGKDVAKGSFEMITKHDHWAGMLDGDYDVSMSSKKIAHFKHKFIDFEMWLALEKDSKYTE